MTGDERVKELKDDASYNSYMCDLRDWEADRHDGRRLRCMATDDVRAETEHSSSVATKVVLGPATFSATRQAEWSKVQSCPTALWARSR